MFFQRKKSLLANASSKLGLYDSRNGKTIKAYKIVDATHLCKDSKKCVIKYAKDTLGTIAQICDWYEPNVDLSTTIHYHINDILSINLAMKETFIGRCMVLQADPKVLADFILENQYK